MSISDFDEMINRKRSRIINLDEIEEKDKPSKKFRSEETKKSKELKLKEINNFMAFIDDKYEDKVFEEKNKLIGEKLNFDYRRKKAIEVINIIKKDKDKDELKLLKESLELDNTNKNSIYKLLVYYYNKKDQINFNETMKKFKFCITKKINIMENGIENLVDLNSFFKIMIPIEELEELVNHEINDTNINDLRNSLVDIFTSYYYIAEYITILEYKLPKNDIKNLLSIKYTNSINNNSTYTLVYEKGEKQKIFSKYKDIKNEIKQKLLTKIEYFLCKYLLNFEFIFFKLNQPVNYQQNLTLYYNYIIFSLYDLAIEVNEHEKKIIFNKSKLFIYSRLNRFHNILFEDYFDQKEPFNKTMDQLLKYLLLLLSIEGKKDFGFLIELIHLKKREKFMDEKTASILIQKINEKFKYINARVEKDKIIFDEESQMSCEKIEIEFKNYINDLSSYKLYEFNWIWENIQFEKFQTTNFFLENDIKYLKYLIKHILSSKLFREIYNNFNNVKSLADFYFANPKNIEDYINRIIFLPFSVENLGKYGITDRWSLSVLVCGYPQKRIYNLEEYRIYRILELSLRSIILADHEPCHFIKSAYSIITEGIISRYTSKSDKDADSGLFLEEILFDWKKEEKTKLDITKLNLSEKIIYKNEVIKKKKIDVITAIQLLNPDIYNKDLNHFRKAIYEITKNDLKSFSFSSITNNEYRTYLQSVIKENTIRELYNDEHYEINASMKYGDNVCLEYISCNHNLGRFW